MEEDICSPTGFDHRKMASDKCPYCGKSLLKSKQGPPPIMQITPEELIEASRRKIMKEKQDKAPRTYTKEKDKYICPHCLEETLSYNEDERLFICSECGRKYALAKIEE